MNPARLLRTIETATRASIEAAGGTLEVSGDPLHALSILADNPRNWRVVLSFGGSQTISQEAQGTAHDVRVDFFVTHNKGLRFKHGDHAHAALAERDNILEAANAVHLIAAALVFTDGAGNYHPEIDCNGLQLQEVAWLIEPDEGPRRDLQLSYQVAMSNDAPDTRVAAPVAP